MQSDTYIYWLSDKSDVHSENSLIEFIVNYLRNGFFSNANDTVKNFVVNNSPNSPLIKREFLEAVLDVLHGEYHGTKRRNFLSSLFKEYEISLCTSGKIFYGSYKEYVYLLSIQRPSVLKQGKFDVEVGCRRTLLLAFSSAYSYLLGSDLLTSATKDTLLPKLIVIKPTSATSYSDCEKYFTFTILPYSI